MQMTCVSRKHRCCPRVCLELHRVQSPRIAFKPQGLQDGVIYPPYCSEDNSLPQDEAFVMGTLVTRVNPLFQNEGTTEKNEDRYMQDVHSGNTQSRSSLSPFSFLSPPLPHNIRGVRRNSHMNMYMRYMRGFRSREDCPLKSTRKAVLTWHLTMMV